MSAIAQEAARWIAKPPTESELWEVVEWSTEDLCTSLKTMAEANEELDARLRRLNDSLRKEGK